MGSKKFWRFIIWLAFWVFFSSPFVCVRGQNSSGRDSLDAVVRDSALRRIRSGRVRSDLLYDNISLPEKFSGVQVSVVRMRSSSLWLGGANFSFFDVPPRTLPWPFSRRIIIVYQNLANLSSVYYNVPNYSFVAPVLGLMAYDSYFSFNGTGNNGSSSSIELKPMKDPILIRFSQISLMPAAWDATSNQVSRKCVRFDTNGNAEFSNLTDRNSCIAWGGRGHFSVVAPIQPPSKPKQRKHKFSQKWRKICIGAGILGLGLVLLICFGILLYELIPKKRIRKMERESDKKESLASIWIGTSRMPSATSIRTQPTLENSYIPR